MSDVTNIYARLYPEKQKVPASHLEVKKLFLAQIAERER